MKVARALAPEKSVGASGRAVAGNEAGGNALDRPLLPFEIITADKIAEIDIGRGDENVGGTNGLLDRFHLARTRYDFLSDPGCAHGGGKGNREHHDSCFSHNNLRSDAPVRTNGSL